MYRSLDKLIHALATATAVIGGIALLAVILMTCLSVLGRALDGVGLGPIPGDIELVELGIGFAVFSTLPYAQYMRAHARVDLLRPLFGAGLNRGLDLLGDLVMLGFTFLVSWRLWLGMLDKAAYGETSFILQIPVVWGYRAAMIIMLVACGVALFCVFRSARVMLNTIANTEAHS